MAALGWIFAGLLNIIFSVNNRRAFLAGFSCFFLMSVISFLMWPREKEPEYQGKKLSYWLFRPPRPPFSEPAAPAEAIASETALRHIGTNAIPCLLKWLSYEPSPLKKKSSAALLRLPARFQPGKLIAYLSESDLERKAFIAEQGFIMLGPDAWPAVETLNQMAGETKRQRRTYRSYRARAVLDQMKQRQFEQLETRIRTTI